MEMKELSEMSEVRLSRMVFATTGPDFDWLTEHCGAGGWRLEAGSWK
jgi:hypothetical protein